MGVRIKPTPTGGRGPAPTQTTVHGGMRVSENVSTPAGSTLPGTFLLHMPRKQTLISPSPPPPGPLQVHAIDTNPIDSVMGHDEMLIAMTVAESGIGNGMMTVTAETLTEV